MTSMNDHSDQEVAIIGMACRLPGATSVGEFWDNLVGGVESITTFTEDDLRAAGVSEGDLQSPAYVRRRGIVGNAEDFAATFFGFSPREAEIVDPQHRVFLECAWRALEDAGYDPHSCSARIGVFGGTGTAWNLPRVHDNPALKGVASPTAIVIANDKDYVTTRVSYKLGLTGPSVNVQSACSTSLVSAILGMNSLLLHQCDMVLVGGVSIETPEKQGYLYQPGGMESPDGICRTFDASAQGTVFSRGAGVVLLKRLVDAIADRDHIYAVIKGGAINNDGSGKAGFTAPSVDGQVRVAVDALEASGVSADSIGYVEAHGTATTLGDPIEVTSLTRAFRTYTDRKQYCGIGSVKTNIGHTDVASGAAGIIKLALALKHRYLPASLHFETPNPKIDFETSPFRVVSQGRPWLSTDGPMRALINSFGVGGTNACAVLEEAPKVVTDAPGSRPKLLLLSAKTESALQTMTSELTEYLECHTEINLADVAYTLQVGRTGFAHRRFVPFLGRADLLQKLHDERSLEGSTSRYDGQTRPLVFMFPGQGNQYVDMGRGLYEAEPVFRQHIEECSRILHSELGFDLREILYPSAGGEATAAERLGQTQFTQPALFTVAYATAKLWMSWGIKPTAMVGHSVGEYVAACLSGVFALRDSLRAVARRGALVQALPGGSMVAVLLPENQVLPLLPPSLEVAALNGPQLTVVAGADDAIDAFIETLTTKKIFHKRLSTSHAFHSRMMEPALGPIANALEHVSFGTPHIPFVSTLTGDWITDSEATSRDYWVRHVRNTVRFSPAVETLLKWHAEGCTFLEVGPGRSLESAVKSLIERGRQDVVAGSIRAPVDNVSDEEYVTRSLGKLWAAGHAPSWGEYYGVELRGRLPLPGHPFERQRLVAYEIGSNQSRRNDKKDNPKLSDVGRWFYVPSWKRTAQAEMLPPVGVEIQAERRDGPQRWLIFADTEGVGQAVAERLERDGHDVVSVVAGQQFRAGPSFTIHPGDPIHYQEMFERLKEDGRAPDCVMHLWNLSHRAPGLHPTSIESAETMCFFSPMHMAQALASCNLLKVRFIVATNGAQNVTGEGVAYPEKALVLGPCRVVNREHPTLRCRAVDVDLPADRGQLERLAENLIRETQLDSLESSVAYRGEHRWTEEFGSAYLPPVEKLGPLFKPGGVYLITGGVGGMGLLIGQFLADRLSAKLVLTHRAPLPDRGEWKSWIDTHAESDGVSAKLRGLMKLEEAGATVMTRQVDVTDESGMRRLVEEVEQRLGRINGVIHSAGVAGGGVISLKTPNAAHEVLDPKVTGTLVLDTVFADRQLDFLLLFSSVTSILGEAGRVDYCGANAFLDAFAHARNRQRPGLTRSINWGQWGIIGMGARWEESQRKPRSDIRDIMAVSDDSTLQRGSGNMGTDGLLTQAAGEADDTYLVNLDPCRDWAIDTHRVLGQPTLVGTGFFEIMRHYAERIAHCSTIGLRDLHFTAPLIFPSGASRRIRLVLKPPSNDGARRFAFQSQSAEPRGGAWTDHLLGELVLDPSTRDSVQSLESIRASLPQEVDNQPFFRRVGGGGGLQPLLDLGERWGCLDGVLVGKGEWLGRLQLPQKFVSDLERTPCHPAMLDVASLVGIRFVTTRPYLPFSYGEVRVYAPLIATVYSHVRLRSGGDEDSLTFDVTLYSPDGDVLVDIQQYTLRRVPGEAASATTSSSEETGSPRGTANPKDILPEEGLDVLRRISVVPAEPQLIVATSDLHGLIEETIPLGKPAEEENVDRRTTRSYGRPDIATPYVEATNEVERAVVGVWEKVLGIRQVGIHDQFNELGGNSLLAIQMIANTSELFQVELTMDRFYRNPTVEGIANAVLAQLVEMTDENVLDELISNSEHEEIHREATA